MKILKLLLFVIYYDNVIGLCNDQISYFERATQSPYFVDKTKLLQYFIEENHLPLATLPRNFGKSTNLDMVRRFFQITVDDQTGQRIAKNVTRNWKLFTNKSLNLKIARDRPFIDEHLGEYPVIYLSFSDIQGTTVDEIMDSIGKQIIHLFSSYRWLFELAAKKSPDLQFKVKSCQEVLHGTADLTAVNIFDGLVKLLMEHFQKRVMVLIDDYDRPTLLALNSLADASQIEKYMHSLLGSFVDEHSRVSHVMVLGRCRLFKKDEKKYIPLDKLQHDYFLQHATGLSEYFGFTEDDVDHLFAKKSIGDKKLVKEYFDGYNFKVNQWENVTKSPLYHPQGVLRYLETGTLDTNHFITDDTLVQKILKCLRHEVFFVELSYLLFGKMVSYMFASPHMSDTDLRSFAQIIFENCSHYDPATMYIFPLIDNGYVSWSGQRYLRIANKMSRKQLNKDVRNFYRHTYGINVVDSRLTSSISTILTSNTTTDDVLAELMDSLQQLIDQKTCERLTTFEFQSIIFGLLYLNFESYNIVDVKEIDKEWSKTFRNFETLRLSNDDKKILLIINVITDGEMDETIRKAREHVPSDPQIKSTFNLVKYLAIKLNGNQRIELACGENRIDW